MWCPCSYTVDIYRIMWTKNDRKVATLIVIYSEWYILNRRVLCIQCSQNWKVEINISYIITPTIGFIWKSRLHVQGSRVQCKRVQSQPLQHSVTPLCEIPNTCEVWLQGKVFTCSLHLRYLLCGTSVKDWLRKGFSHSIHFDFSSVWLRMFSEPYNTNCSHSSYSYAFLRVWIRWWVLRYAFRQKVFPHSLHS